MYPQNFNKKNVTSLQSRLFGHRLKPAQTKYEYLIEFLQVAISPKENYRTGEPYNEMFPIKPNGFSDALEFFPESRIGLKRFIFMPNSKLDGKATVDLDAYDACVKTLEEHVSGGPLVARKEAVNIIQNLLLGFSAVNQNRSWFDQNVLPICPEVILPEGMGVKKDRKGLVFQQYESYVDGNFDYHKYTYMCRGGEIYYLHLLNAINQFPEKEKFIEKRIYDMITNFTQFSYLCNFVQETWDNFMLVPEEDKSKSSIRKELGAIPSSFAQRNEYTISELTNFLNSKIHPFEKMDIFSNGLILQLLRMMYIAAATEEDSNCWVLDVNCVGFQNNETKKAAIAAFKRNEETICKYLYRGLNELKEELAIDDESKAINDAADDSYRLFRKLGKMIGIVIPSTGPGMRFSISEEVIKFLVLSIVPPQSMITLDEFIELLYQHFGMVIGPEQYRIEMEEGFVKQMGDLSFFEENKRGFAQKLKDCGFLRDLSDATSIVENPYESEDQI